jgi:hypothetical protein
VWGCHFYSPGLGRRSEFTNCGRRSESTSPDRESDCSSHSRRSDDSSPGSDSESTSSGGQSDYSSTGRQPDDSIPGGQSESSSPSRRSDHPSQGRQSGNWATPARSQIQPDGFDVRRMAARLRLDLLVCHKLGAMRSHCVLAVPSAASIDAERSPEGL